ncbi:1,6-anhydro-N-acetylmuramyl-L-alanine amidase AmpD [Thioalkalivibrio sp. ALE20]|uniref:1,6-anhydro-N-acetylmuramyl-L-alanine amidase AmpD n=1 Tax=Thioalkalivibrio sp. ALE20 TaxID=545275 RepID=UPI00037D7BEF|nr:1,6-anhydro-N-acetylmuramyl-L-alanine amidase AmpD [Thioalkalivibrio sp. ALE20]
MSAVGEDSGARDWWPAAECSESPNQDARPAGMQPELIVVHAISLPPGEFGGSHVEALFHNRLDPDAHPFFAGIRDLRVSAHVFIDREGRATQFVPFSRRAWHAGVSTWRGRERCNDFSIGIELEGDDHTPFAAEQYTRLAALTHWLRQRFPAIAADALAGHSDIAPGRKTDPGPCFDWDRLHALLGNLEPSTPGESTPGASR